MGVLGGNFKFIESNNYEISARVPLQYPPQPPPELLFGDPTEGIYLGVTEFLNTPVYWNPKYLTNPHIVIVGISGSGKSYTIKTFLLRASYVWNANAVIIDWAGEYKEWVSQTNGKVVSLGGGNYLNIMDLGGMKPYARIQQIVQTLDLLVGISESQEQKRLLEWALETAYLNAGFRLDSSEQYDPLGRPLEPPTLKDVVKLLEEKIELESNPYIKRELQTLTHKLRQFTRPGDDYFANKSTLSLDELISSGLVDLDLSTLPSEQMRALGALTVLQFIKEKMRTEDFRRIKGIRLFVVIDEAWKISKEENSDVVMIVREGRKYGFSMIIASQNPVDIAEAIFSNAGTVLMLKVRFENYLNYLQGSLRFSNFVREKIQSFGVGQGAMYLSYYVSGNFSNTVILSKIEGEIVIKDYFIMLNVIEGDTMGSVSITREEFRSKLRAMGVDVKSIESISSSFEKNNNRLDVIEFVKLMMLEGIDRKLIVEFLKDLGVEDQTIAKAILRAQMRIKGSERIAEVKL
ncbi:MAG: DUF87 domain-containing protein [Candidatus Anstonellales archaeon]